MSDQILNKLDKIQSDIVDIKIEQAKQGEHVAQNTDDLKDHIEGVKQNRARIELLEKSQASLSGLWKAVIATSIILGIIGTLLTILVNIGRLTG